MKVILSSTARFSLQEIISVLKARWTQKEIDTVINDIKKFRTIISDGIIKHQSLENYSHIKFTIIGKRQVKLFYEIKKDYVVIKLFWHCKQDPAKLNEFLNKNQ